MRGKLPPPTTGSTIRYAPDATSKPSSSASLCKGAQKFPTLVVRSVNELTLDSPTADTFEYARQPRVTERIKIAQNRNRCNKIFAFGSKISHDRDGEQQWPCFGP